MFTKQLQNSLLSFVFLIVDISHDRHERVKKWNVICCRYGVLGVIDEFSKGGMKQGWWQGRGETREAISWNACILLLCVVELVGIPSVRRSFWLSLVTKTLAILC